MRKFIKFSVFLCLVLVISTASRAAFAKSVDDQILARLNALEKENAALRTRVSRLEAFHAAAGEGHRAIVLARATPTPVALPQADYVLGTGNVAGAGTAEIQTPQWRPHFAVSGSFLYLQPGSGDFEQYATLVSPLPVPSPNWSNQSINPKYSPAFNVGLSYMPTESDDVALNWTHLNTSDGASVAAGPTQFVGPPYSVGPPAGAAFTGGTANDNLQTQYDAVNLDAGHTFCADCSFQLQVFGGVQFARIRDTLTGTFQSADGSTFHQYTSNSLFAGAGPHLGVKGQYNLGNLQFFGEASGAGLIGSSQSSINFTTASPTLLGLGIVTNYQALTSPSATQVVPSVDARVGAAYFVPFRDYGLFKFELGYQAAIYFDAVNEYALSNVAGSPLSGGVYLATEQQSHANFTTQGPYFSTSWLF